MAGKGGFGVFAYSTQNTEYAVETAVIPNFMYNQKVEKDAEEGTGADDANRKNVTSWKYTPLKYWPNEYVDNAVDTQTEPAKGVATNGNVSFFAYAPYVNLTTGGVTSTNDITGVNNTSDKAIDGALTNINNTSGATGIVAITNNEYQGHPYLRYKMKNPGIFDENVDLLWGTSGTNGAKAAGGAQAGTLLTGGKATVNVNLNKMTKSGKVDFLFKHALAGVGGSGVGTDPLKSKTGLSIVVDTDDPTSAFQTWEAAYGDDNVATKGNVATKVTVESIEITNDLDFDGTYETEEKAQVVTDGVLNLATGEWKLGTEKADGTYFKQVINGNGTGDDLTGVTYAQLNSKIANPASITVGTWFSHVENEGDNPGVNHNQLSVYNGEVQPFVYIPGTTPSLAIKIKYHVYTKDPSLKDGYTHVVQTVAKKLTFANALELNKKYGIKIILGLTSVKFTATVDNWGFAGDDDNDGVQDGGETLIVEDIYLPKNVD